MAIHLPFLLKHQHFEYYYGRLLQHIQNYFFLQILFNQLIEKNPEYNCPIESDCTPHILQQIINTGYQEVTFDEAVRMSNIHKLTYKDPHAATRLKALLKEHV